MGVNLLKAKEHNCAIAKMDDILLEQLEKSDEFWIWLRINI